MNRETEQQSEQVKVKRALEGLRGPPFMYLKVHTVVQVTLIIDTACLTQTTAESPQSLVCEHDMPVANGFAL